MSDYISEECFLLIFKSLPVRTLLRFRCVCKWWKGLIDDPSFVLEHLAVQKPRFIADSEVPNEFLVLDPRTLPVVDTLTDPIRAEPEQNLRLLATLHGVVLLSASKSEYLLWNPSIRKLSSIPPLPRLIGLEIFYSEEEYTLSSFFGWDDHQEDATFSGFWIDPETKDFKILTFRLVRTDQGCFTPLHGICYSSIIQEWGQMTLADPCFYNCWPMPGGSPPVMVGDVAHWRAFVQKVDSDDEDEDDGEYDQAAILWYDFIEEMFGYINVSNKDYSGGHFQPVLCKLQDELSLMCWDSKVPFRCDIYALKEGLAFVKMFSFTQFPCATLHVFCVLEQMKDRCRALAIDARDLVLYDSKDGCIALRRGIQSPLMYFVYDFVESLLFP